MRERDVQHADGVVDALIVLVAADVHPVAVEYESVHAFFGSQQGGENKGSKL